LDAYLSQSQVQRQSQVLAPQLRQSLEILQAPVQELQALITKELELNPTLDLVEPIREHVEVEPGRDESYEDISDREFEEEFQLLAQLDDANRDHFFRNEVIQRPASDEDSVRQFMMESLTRSETLQDHLMAQVQLSSLQGFELQVAEILIGSLDDDGYLAAPLEELADSIGASLHAFQWVLEVIQDFDPAGIAARSLRECLCLQLKRMDREDSLAYRIADGYLRELGGHKYAEIARSLDVGTDDVQRAAREIARLNPKPGRLYTDDPSVYVVPEIFVERKEGGWHVRTEKDHLPKIRISRQYKDLMNDPSTPKDVKRYIRERMKAGGTLMKSIGLRQSTIVRIAFEIVKVQREFLEEGVSKLKPLTMSEVAEKLGVHETTVSRAVSNKYMSTPQGVFEMKYFFTPGYKGEDGELVSNKSIKDAIRKLVDSENPAKPLSDQAMVKALTGQGFKVARRTIAKYRDELKILPSHLRKQI
jgi:RNA polymerase sigma-54 factor